MQVEKLIWLKSYHPVPDTISITVDVLHFGAAEFLHFNYSICQLSHLER